MKKKVIIGAIILLFVFFYYERISTGENAQKNVQIGAAFLAENAQKEGVKSTDSGLQYEILEKGQGSIHPTVESNITVTYHGTLIDGSVFDSSEDKPISFVINQTIAGWKEGVPLMMQGDTFRFYIPSNLAYGDRDIGKISAGSLLIFDVHLISIN